MSDKKVHATIATYVIPTGTKVVNESGEEVGEIVQWSPASDGRVDIQAVITDEAMAEAIKRGGSQTFSIGSKIALDPSEPEDG